MSSTLPSDLASSKDLLPASLPLDKCIPRARFPTVASPPTKTHHACHPNASSLNTAESPRDWPDEPGTPLPSTHPPTSTSCKSTPPQCPTAPPETAEASPESN